MGNCIYCGKPAGFLRHAHKKCKEKHERGAAEIVSLVAGLPDESKLSSIDSRIEEIKASSFIKDDEIKSLVVSGWEKAVEEAFEDDMLTEAEEKSLTALADRFLLDQKDLDRHGSYSKVVKGALLRDILNGNLPDRIKVEGALPFNLQKTEKLVWVFKGVDYLVQKTRREYEGGMSGVSIRVARGLYFRTGGFRGRPVERTETVNADRGLLGVTNKHIYFVGDNNSFRIRYEKIVSFKPYSDGIGIMRDSSRAKPEAFITGDGWFTYNLVTNLAKM
ncbi:MAG: hypothetical protein B6D63_01135 [Candidatus Latescibacteria bacterium 4484_7]|nr:MAG: hypothetical protein B6D63_01135 [Candidatus Latescibacteria bacterium 4484_7]